MEEGEKQCSSLLAGWLAGLLDCLVDCLVGWLAGLLTDQLIIQARRKDVQFPTSQRPDASRHSFRLSFPIPLLHSNRPQLYPPPPPPPSSPPRCPSG